MPKPATKFSPKLKPSTKGKGPTKRNVRRKLIFILATSAACLTLAGYGIKTFWLPQSNDQVLSESAFQPTALDQNFEQQVKGCLLPVAKVYGYHLDIASGFRSSIDQDALYAQGRTTPGDVVTNAQGGQSLHNFGLAIDVVDDLQSYDIDWQRLGKIGAYCGLEQGDRGHEDLPHFQYRGGLTRDQIASGQKPPRLRIPCQLIADRYNQHQPLSKTDLDTCKVPKY